MLPVLLARLMPFYVSGDVIPIELTIIDNILRNHSGINIKILKLQLYGIYDAYQYLDS